jgi:hypothetical protein
MYQQKAKRLLPLLAAVCLAAMPLLGQLGVGTIAGRVTDASGSVIPGAAIRVTNVDTNVTQESQTNAEGLFRVPSLNPGTYRVEIETTGFKTFVRQDLQVRTGSTSAVDATLEVGAVTEQIEVTGETPLLDTESSALGAAVEGEILYKLPNYQRYTASTLNFVPGITTGGYAYGGSLGNYRVAGQRASATGAFDDGVPANDNGGGTNYVKPVMNAVEEVKVFTTALPAEYGHTASGVMDIVKKSGTNQFHGLASLYGRSRRMQHRLFFDRDTSENLNQQVMFLLPDFNLSGPVIKNKTFFFLAYQHLIEKKAANAFRTVPTAQMYQGDFGWEGANALFDPASDMQLPNGDWAPRTAFVDNIIPTSRFDPTSAAFLNADPWFGANLAPSYDSEGPDSNFEYTENARTFFHDWTSRFDHNWTSAVKTFFSVSSNKNDGLARFPRNVRLEEFDGGDGHATPETNTNWSLGTTWVINPTMISDTRIGLNRRYQTRVVAGYGEGLPATLGLTAIDQSLVPDIDLYNVTKSGPFKNVDETLSLRTDMTKIAGTHTVKFGYEILRLRRNRSNVGQPSGAFNWSNMTANVNPSGSYAADTGIPFAAFLLGAVNTVDFDQELAMWQPRSNINSFYVQDDWKVSPTLTLNLGMRYSAEGQFDTKYGLHTNWSPTAIDPLTGRTGGFIHDGEPLAGTDQNNFQPRIGLAWNLSPNTVFRAGFAVNTIDIKYPDQGGNFEEYRGAFQYDRPSGDPRSIFDFSDTPAPHYNILADGTSPFSGANLGGREATFWDPNMKNAQAYNWNLSVQREFGGEYLVEMSYQGSSGVHLMERWDYNIVPLTYGDTLASEFGSSFEANEEIRGDRQAFIPFGHFGRVRMRSNFGHSSYHSGTIRLEKRYGNTGLNLLTFYTLSKSINSQDSDSSGSGQDPLNNRALEKALAGYHRAHRAVITVLYELPFGEGKRFLNQGGWMNHVFGGWEVSAIQTMESGNPREIALNGSMRRFNDAAWRGISRPNAAMEDPALYSDWRERVTNADDRFTQSKMGQILDPAFFGNPGDYQLGNLGRNVVTQGNLIWTQVSAQKNIYFTERVIMKFRWDMQNALKHYNFDNFTNSFDTRGANLNNFAKVTSDPRTASIGGQPLMNLTLSLQF